MNESQSIRIDKVIRERSLKAAYMQALYWAVTFGAGECYFSLFAEHLQAPEFVFGLLGGVPNLLGPLVQALGASLVERTRTRKRLVLYAVAVQGFAFLPLAALPFLVQKGSASCEYLLLGFVLLYFMGAHFGTPAWNSMLSVLVPANQRGEWFARMSRDNSVVSLIVKLAIGGGLYWAGDASGSGLKLKIFAIGFLSAAIFRVFSFRQVWKMYDPPYEHTPADSFSFWQFLRRAPESNFVKFVFFVALVQFGALIAGPYFVPYTIRVLGYEQWHWVLLDASAVVASIMTLLFWGRFSTRVGNKKVLKYTTYGVALIPVLWLLSNNFYFLLVANFYSGMTWAGFNLCAFNYILEACSPPKRARCLAYFSIIVGVGIFAGAMLGGWLGDHLPQVTVLGRHGAVLSSFPYLLVLSAAVRLAAGVFFVPAFKELGQVEPFSLTKWIYYVAQTRLPVGVEFEANVEEGEDEEKT